MNPRKLARCRISQADGSNCGSVTGSYAPALWNPAIDHVPLGFERAVYSELDSKGWCVVVLGLIPQFSVLRPAPLLKAELVVGE